MGCAGECNTRLRCPAMGCAWVSANTGVRWPAMGSSCRGRRQLLAGSSCHPAGGCQADYKPLHACTEGGGGLSGRSREQSHAMDLYRGLNSQFVRSCTYGVLV
eukprot:95956-Chlamydomonas_euryale.AAC.1